MKRVTDEVIETIRNRLHLAEIMTDAGLALKRVGKDWRGRCPFEPDSRNASKFRVDERRYHCYGCGAMGDVFSWFQEWDHLRFPDAVAYATDRAAIALEYRDPDGPTRERTESQARRINACQEALVVLADLSQITAFEQAARVIGETPVDELVGTGEVGLLPDAQRIRDRLDALGVGEQARRDSGIDATLLQLAGRWMLWARRHDHIYVGRPVGNATARIGPYGNQSRGWVSAPVGERRGSNVMIAGDDSVYLALRTLGVGGVYRPLSDDTIEGTPEGPRLDHVTRPPFVIVRPGRIMRQAAFEQVLRLLPINSRVRVAEVELHDLPTDDAMASKALLAQILARCGTALDWQTELMAAQRAFDSEAGRLAAATRLGQLADATTAPVERLAYTLEIDRLTSIPQPVTRQR